MSSMTAGTLAGAGSFHCADCNYAVHLEERDELPSCPACGGSEFERTSLFGQTTVLSAAPLGAEPDEAAEWVAEARAALAAPGDYLAYEAPDRVHVNQLQEGWTRVGRSLSAHVRLDDPTVSRRHALIYRDPEGARVLDDRSLNGVFRNGERIEHSRLADGDVIGVGRFRLFFLALTHEDFAERLGRTAI